MSISLYTLAYIYSSCFNVDCLSSTFLQNRGVFGNFTLLEELPCDIFPFDNDLMSMELDMAFKVLLKRGILYLCMTIRLIYAVYTYNKKACIVM